MYLHKTAGGETLPVPASAAKAVPSAAKVLPSAQGIKAPLPNSAAVPPSVFTVAAAAGLPADGLSAAIITFSRFFSLPIKPELMADIRRQALSQPDPQAAPPNREALALAAAAAESKGVELSPKGLEWFAEAIDPHGQKRHDQEKRRGRRNTDHDEQKPAKTSPVRYDAITAADLRTIAMENAAQDPLLTILNQLPGKNRQRWMVLPFHFSENGREFRVSLRILLNGENPAENSTMAVMAGDTVAVDIAETGSMERRWLFILHMANGAINRLGMCLHPAFPAQTQVALTGELSRLLGISPEHIVITSRTEAFPCEAGWMNEPWPSINEAV